jgi:hypothetical protein
LKKFQHFHSIIFQWGKIRKSLFSTVCSINSLGYSEVNKQYNKNWVKFIRMILNYQFKKKTPPHHIQIEKSVKACWETLIWNLCATNLWIVNLPIKNVEHIINFTLPRRLGSSIMASSTSTIWMVKSVPKCAPRNLNLHVSSIVWFCWSTNCKKFIR